MGGGGVDAIKTSRCWFARFMSAQNYVVFSNINLVVGLYCKLAVGRFTSKTHCLLRFKQWSRKIKTFYCRVFSSKYNLNDVHRYNLENSPRCIRLELFRFNNVLIETACLTIFFFQLFSDKFTHMKYHVRIISQYFMNTFK